MIVEIENLNPKCCYLIKPPEEIGTNETDIYQYANQKYISREFVDYFIDGDVDTRPKIPLSFSKIRSVEQAIEFYTEKHPELCDDIIEMIARNQFGNLPIKNARQKKIDDDNKVSFTKTQTTINFD
tara:strand:+ start:165 stop:542 length:378 start_codon:yes stop_codon:yes gene_type:complete